jgi:hypothetical protein
LIVAEMTRDDDRTARASLPPPAGTAQEETMKVRIDVDGTPLLANLVDTAPGRDFASLLPLRLTLTDYAGTEKISDLPRRLSIEGAPAGVKPAIGDITYYAPWGNLAIFHRDAGYAVGLVRLGTVESGLEALRRPGTVEITIALDAGRAQ